MSKRLLLSVLLVLGVAAGACANEPVQFALWNPVQTVHADQSISGVRIGLFYTLNQDVTGFSTTLLGVDRTTGGFSGLELSLINWVGSFAHGVQLGVVNRAATRFVGYQGGLVNVTEGDFTGLQDGVVNWTEGFLHGWQSGLVNFTRGRFVGLQNGFVNVVNGDCSGVQLGAVSYTEGMFKGVQAGIFNYANDMTGLQLGLVNVTKKLNGLQIGLGNYNGSKEPFEFLPLVNWSF